MFDFLDYAERLYFALMDLGDFFFCEAVWVKPIRAANALLPTGFKIETEGMTVGLLLFGYALTGILLFRLLKFFVGIVTGS